jgi:hypothetical protein
MGLRDRVRTLTRRAEGPMVEIERPDGTYARFPQSELGPAYLVVLDRECGHDVDHPLARAARNSSDPKWRNSVWAGPEKVPEEPPEDLSEP